MPGSQDIYRMPVLAATQTSASQEGRLCTGNWTRTSELICHSRFENQIARTEEQLAAIQSSTLRNLVSISHQHLQVQSLHTRTPDPAPEQMKFKRQQHARTKEKGLIAEEIVARRQREQ